MNDMLFPFSEKGTRRAEKQGNLTHESKMGAENQPNRIVVIGTCRRNETKDLRIITQGNPDKEDIITALGGRITKAKVLVM